MVQYYIFGSFCPIYHQVLQTEIKNKTSRAKFTDTIICEAETIASSTISSNEM